MEIIDCQSHELEPHQTWNLDRESALRVNVELAREAMDAVGVDVLVLTASGAAIDAAVDYYPQRFRGVEVAPIAIRDPAAFVAGYRERPGRLALRMPIRDWRTGGLTKSYQSGEVGPFLAAAEECEVPVFISAQGHPQEVRKIAQRHPGLTMIVNHLGLPQRPMSLSEDPWECLPMINQLAEYEQVAIQFCGGPTLAGRAPLYEEAWTHLKSMVDAFGANRLMWASDITRMRMEPRSIDRGPRERWGPTYMDSLAFVRDTEVLNFEQKEWILGRSARHLLRF